jgi:hypothetical protein
MRAHYKMRQVLRRFTVPSSIRGYEHIKLQREELECGHVIRARDPQSTVEAMAAAFHSVNGTKPRRRCFQCAEGEAQ